MKAGKYMKLLIVLRNAILSAVPFGKEGYKIQEEHPEISNSTYNIVYHYKNILHTIIEMWYILRQVSLQVFVILCIIKIFLRLEIFASSQSSKMF